MIASPPIEPTSPELPHGFLRRAFPFFVEWDVDLQIRSTGPSLLKVCPSVVSGIRITEVFAMKRPVGEMTADFFRGSGHLLYLFEFKETGLILRGEILTLEDDRGFLMLGAPWISDPDEIERLGLTLLDFAIHDQTMDLLQVVQRERIANGDLKRLAERLENKQERLKEQQAEARKLSIVASRTDNAVVMTDAAGFIEWVNDGFVRITEWTLPEVVGKKPGSFLQGEGSDPAVRKKIREHLARGESVKAEILNYSKSGRKYWIATEIQPIHDDEGRITNFMAIQSDITERKEATRQLRETNALQRAMLEGAGFAIIGTEVDGVIRLFNASAEKLLGYTAEELMAEKATPVKFHLDRELESWAKELSMEFGRTVPAGFDVFVAKAKLGIPDEREWTYVHRNGSKIPVLLSVTALFDDSQMITGYLAIATDLTNRKRREQKLRSTLADLELINRVMMDREERVIDLKREINILQIDAGLPPAYPSVMDDETQPEALYPMI